MNGFPSAFRSTGASTLVAADLVAVRHRLSRFRVYLSIVWSRSSQRTHPVGSDLCHRIDKQRRCSWGAAAGSVASGKLTIPTETTPTADFVVGWISPLAVFTGFYSVGHVCLPGGGVSLTREAHAIGDDHLTTIWRQRALSTGVWMGLLSFGGTGDGGD